jgi:preprotein translocase subunit YajC
MTLAALLLFQPSAGSTSMVPTFALYGAIFAIFYFVLLRPQTQQRKKHDQAIQAVKKGDEIVSTGGVIGIIVHIKTVGADGTTSAHDRVTITSGDTRLVIERGSIARLIVPTVTEAKGTT